MFGQLKIDWLKRFIKLENGIPSHDTIARVFSLIDPKKFETCFLTWVNELADKHDQEIIAIDGKTVRGSYDNASNKKAIHMVNAWAVKNGLSLGQLKTYDKSNEITAIPDLLDTLMIKGATITIDAMGCQKTIAKKITDKKADYVLGLKKNHQNLWEDVSLKFNTTNLDLLKGTSDFYEEVDGDHGRITTRTYITIPVEKWLEQADQWQGLKSVGRVRTVTERDGKTTEDERFYLISFLSDAARFAFASRSHWHIENKLHWVLDVTFSEDKCRIRKNHAPQNFSIIRRITMNLLKKEKSVKGSIPSKRMRAALREDYLTKVLGA